MGGSDQLPIHHVHAYARGLRMVIGPDEAHLRQTFRTVRLLPGPSPNRPTCCGPPERARSSTRAYSHDHFESRIDPRSEAFDANHKHMLRMLAEVSALKKSSCDAAQAARKAAAAASVLSCCSTRASSPLGCGAAAAHPRQATKGRSECGHKLKLVNLRFGDPGLTSTHPAKSGFFFLLAHASIPFFAAAVPSIGTRRARDRSIADCISRSQLLRMSCLAALTPSGLLAAI